MRLAGPHTSVHCTALHCRLRLRLRILRVAAGELEPVEAADVDMRVAMRCDAMRRRAACWRDTCSLIKSEA